MKRRSIQHHMDGLMALLLFGVFAVCVLAVLLTGAKAYRRLTERDQSAYQSRTCAQYLATRVRQADQADGVYTEDFGGADALVLEEDGYLTRVYCYEGALMELYCAVDAEMEPRDGEEVMSAQELSLELEDGLLTAVLTGADGREETLYLSLRGQEEMDTASPSPLTPGIMSGAVVPDSGGEAAA